jgi:sec-independent protein translocase protein TatA
MAMTPIMPMFIGNIGPWGFLLIAIVVLVLFGRGKVSGLMGELGKGITSFKKGVAEGKDEIESAMADEAKDVTESAKKDDA